MPLSRTKFKKMEYLLGKSRLEGLSFLEEKELKNLIIEEQPSAQDSTLDDLITIGLILAGLYALHKIFE
ncbi:MAG: hypothetical protein P1P80_09625 [ANME-2 cluster archaeon]|nr:hypothetical protein [ANME-2 cluster archaeon]